MSFYSNIDLKPKQTKIRHKTVKMTRSCLFFRRIRTFFIENNLHAKIYRFKWSKYQYTSQYIFVQTNEFTFNLANRCR